jgi:hypothetical protein
MMIAEYVSNRRFLNRDSLNLIERQLLTSTTTLHDRTDDWLTLDEIEKISV